MKERRSHDSNIEALRNLLNYQSQKFLNQINLIYRPDKLSTHTNIPFVLELTMSFLQLPILAF